MGIQMYLLNRVKLFTSYRFRETLIYYLRKIPCLISGECYQNGNNRVWLPQTLVIAIWMIRLGPLFTVYFARCLI